MSRETRVVDLDVERRARVVAALSRCPLLHGLTPVEIDGVADRCGWATFDSRTDVFVEAQPCDRLWILESGRVRLYQSGPDGRQQVVGFPAPGAALELGPALDGRAYATTATTLEPSTLIFLPRTALGAVSRRYPETVRNAIDQLCLELRQRNILGAIAALKDARERVGCALLQMAYQYGKKNGAGVRIDYKLTRQDIADRAGITLETAIRIMSDLQHRGVVRTESQIVELVDVRGLRDTAECGDCQLDCSVFGPYRPT
ncbi:MAG: Crp/Fnr family transcriptional regulator [Chloroflexi bacterium]|nr:Crp/Fnr family transcriptional regulator [Chloroflexota bacterium]